MRARELTKIIKRFDRKLFCTQRSDGVFVVKRENFVPETYELDGFTLVYLRNQPKVIFYLTHDWSVRGHKANWCVDSVLRRLTQIDTWNRQLFDEIDRNHQKAQESEKRHFKNEIEAWASDSRSEFKEAFKDFNTSTVEKKDRRYLKDKQIKN